MAGARILVVDDEQPIREMLVRFLRAEQLSVSAAADGETALRLLAQEDPAVVVLDILMPGMDGLEVLRRLRQRSDAHVILLTARAEETDKVVGLGIGADDYVTKPFSPRELVARVKAALRRREARAAGTTADEVIHAGDLLIDRGRHEVRRDGRPVDLTALEFELLALLASAPGRVFTRRQLLEGAWGYDFFGEERVVDVHVRNLRRALGDDAETPMLIATVRGVGYKLLAAQP